MDATGEMATFVGPNGRPEYYDQPQPSWQQQQPQHQQQQGGLPGSYSPGSRMVGPGMYGNQGAQGQHQEHPYEYPNQQEQQVAATMAHQQDQRGVSQLQGAASAASAGLGRPSMMQVSPGQGHSLNQPMNSLAGVGSGVLQGSQADLNKRGPVEFNHAISYVNKIKVCACTIIKKSYCD